MLLVGALGSSSNFFVRPRRGTRPGGFRCGLCTDSRWIGPRTRPPSIGLEPWVSTARYATDYMVSAARKWLFMRTNIIARLNL